MKLHWSGPRQSDIKKVSLFDKSTTIFGADILNHTSFSSEYGYRINHNIENPNVDAFFIEKLTREINENPDIKIMHYNPYTAYEYGELVVAHSVCLNTRSILTALQEKIEMKIWMSNYCENIPSIVLTASQCHESELKKLFPDANEFVLQKNTGSGGFGTKILNYEQGPNKVLDTWNNKEELLVTPYLYPSIPLNLHIIVYKDDVLLLPPSVQLICPDSSGRLIYRGADYAAYHELSQDIKDLVLNNAKTIGEQLRRYEYLGVAGIDFLYHHNTLYFLEINPRFQASTALLNKALIAQGFPSVHELNLNAFHYEKPSLKIIDLRVPYSNFCYDSNNIVSKHILSCCKNNTLTELDLDGYKDEASNENTYQFRINFPYNISSVDCSGFVNIHDNIVGNPSILQITRSEILQIKFELLNQGIRISSTALTSIKQKGDIRSAVFDSIDITIFGRLKINCPYKTKLSEFSPYIIDIENDTLLLKRYNQTISSVSVDLADVLSNKKTSNSIKYHEIATLATDRLRINHTSICYFKATARGCAFCNLPDYNPSYNLSDIYQVIDFYLENCDFRHFLIGGGSGQGYSEIEHIIRIARYIKHKCNKSVYAMCLPPQNPAWIKMLYDAKIDEIAFNIEIFDREIAKKIMPGKGYIPLENYYNCLGQAVSLWGRDGNVRSIVMLGLEPQEFFMQGIQKLCHLGVQPVLSAFRPLKNTPLENSIPMPSRRIMDIYLQAEELCKSSGLHLGPSCFECQNNTVSFHPNNPFYLSLPDSEKQI